jgi:hypothetical protein
MASRRSNSWSSKESDEAGDVYDYRLSRSSRQRTAYQSLNQVGGLGRSSSAYSSHVRRVKPRRRDTSNAYGHSFEDPDRGMGPTDPLLPRSYGGDDEAFRRNKGYHYNGALSRLEGTRLLDRPEPLRIGRHSNRGHETKVVRPQPAPDYREAPHHPFRGELAMIDRVQFQWDHGRKPTEAEIYEMLHGKPYDPYLPPVMPKKVEGYKPRRPKTAAEQDLYFRLGPDATGRNSTYSRIDRPDRRHSRKSKKGRFCLSFWGSPGRR